MKRFSIKLIPIAVGFFLSACQGNTPAKTSAEGTSDQIANSETPAGTVQLEAESFSGASFEPTKEASVTIPAEQWLGFTVEIPETGRYRVVAMGSSANGGAVWVEDYVGNKDDRTYDITGKMRFSSSDMQEVSIDGSPLQAGSHSIRIHSAAGEVKLDWVRFELMIPHSATKEVLEQQMDGDEWELVWSDEFDADGMPDTTKWTYNVGNWGWGNNELQYYTNADTKNARVEDGNLIIQAHKDAEGEGWSSARLTTQGKTAFLYGKIEFRAKVPTGRGTWSAGWLLGDDYRDEISWPYCGEIDVLECVGYEIDDETGDGINHATCHTRAYYFKQGNQIGSEIEVSNMNGEYHTYAVEWYPNEIRATLDGEHYYTYDKTANELEWPFSKPQNIIVNLAIGGGWGGLKGLDENLNEPEYILDYVRVYARK
jgi:beta-glucanase (GH16 family)